MEAAKELLRLELAVMEKLLQGDNSEFNALRAQLSVAQVSRREYTGVGFFTHFRLPEGARRLARTERFTIGDIEADIDGLKHGAGFVLFVSNGSLDLLEGYTYDEPWPDNIDSFRVRRAAVGSAPDLAPSKERTRI